MEGPRVTARPARSPRSAVAAAVVASVVLGGPIVGSLLLAAVASSGCVIGSCESARPDLPVTALWLGLALLMTVDIVLWAVAGYRRWSRGWLFAAIGLLMVPVAALAAGRIAGAF